MIPQYNQGCYRIDWMGRPHINQYLPWRNLKRGYVCRDDSGKYFITPSGTAALDIINYDNKKETPVEVKKADLSKELLNYIITRHPELVANFCNENGENEKFVFP